MSAASPKVAAAPPAFLRLSGGGRISTDAVAAVLDVKHRVVLTKTGATVTLAPHGGLRELQRLLREEGR